MNTEPISLDRYISAVWRAKWLIGLGIVLAGGVAFWLAKSEPASYSSKALIKIGRVWKEPLEDPFITEELINGSDFSRELSQQTGLKRQQLKRGLKAETVMGGARKSRYPILVGITATADTAEEASRISEAAAESVVARHQKLFDAAVAPHKAHEQALETRLKEAAQSPGLREFAIKIESDLAEVKANNDSPLLTEKTQMVQANTALSASPPSGRRSAAVAGAIAVVVCILIVSIVEHFKPRNPATE